MAEKTFDELLSGAQTIRDNELPESNTHTLVGEQLVNMVEKNKEESGKKLAISDLASGRGESTTTAMTQAAVTQELETQEGKMSLFTCRSQIVVSENSVTLKAGRYFLRCSSLFQSFDLTEDIIYEFTGSTALVFSTVDKTIVTRSLSSGDDNYINSTDIILAASDAVEKAIKNTPLYLYVIDDKINQLFTKLNESDNGINKIKLANGNIKNTNKGSFEVTTDAIVKDIAVSPFDIGDIIRLKIDTKHLSAYRILGISSSGNSEFISNENSVIGDYIYIVIDRDDYSSLRISVGNQQIISEGIVDFEVCQFDDAGSLYELYLLNKSINELFQNKADKAFVDEVSKRVYSESKIISNTPYRVKSTATNYIDINTIPQEAGDYYINVKNNVGSVTSFRMVAYKEEGGSDTILSHTQPIGQDIEFSISILYTHFRVIIESNYVTTEGLISIELKTIPHDIAEDINSIKESVENNSEDIEELKSNTGTLTILFPVPSDIYCAVGIDMNLYYENMYGMLVGSGYMFIDSPSIVYDTTAEDIGDYDGFLNLERQLHFKPNKEGDMVLYLNVWDEYMRQIASKRTTLHVVDTAYLSGKVVNMLVNGSSSIDMGTFQSEIKRLLETAGATVNMVGRWASGNNKAETAYNLKVDNRLSENRSGGASNLFTTKANDGKTKIVHPTNITDTFFGWSTELEDSVGNRWSVWGNSTDFVELVLKSGDIDTLPSSGIMNKISGAGESQLIYDRLITNVPQTTNPFWSNADNGISFIDYCNNWNRPTPNVFVTLWGTNDIGGSSGNIETGKQWATDSQINTFVERQKVLVDAFIRDCPNGIVIMCPQPTGSTITGKKNSDRNGMLYSKLKATQALMDAFKDYDRVYIVPVLWWFDRKWSYTIRDMTISQRMKDFYNDILLDKVTDDSTHPQARGYYQMSDAAYSAIVYALKNHLAP